MARLTWRSSIKLDYSLAEDRVQLFRHVVLFVADDVLPETNFDVRIGFSVNVRRMQVNRLNETKQEAQLSLAEWGGGYTNCFCFACNNSITEGVPDMVVFRRYTYSWLPRPTILPGRWGGRVGVWKTDNSFGYWIDSRTMQWFIVVFADYL